MQVLIQNESAVNLEASIMSGFYCWQQLFVGQYSRGHWGMEYKCNEHYVFTAIQAHLDGE